MVNRVASAAGPPSAGFETETGSRILLPNPVLVSQILFTNNGVRRMTTTRQFDALNRLTRITSLGGTGSTLSAFAYTYNAANQRVRVDLADGSFWLYEYDALGQVKSGKRYWPDGTPVAGQQFEYSFDAMGNRTGTKAGGDANGWNLRQAGYTANLLKQYSSRTVAGGFDVLGLARGDNAGLAVNGQPPYRRGEYFWREVVVNNTGTAVWQAVSVTATGESPVSGNVFVPRTPETFTHDADGNLLSDGRWNYTWDAENRLVRVESRSDTPQASWRRVEWQYDGLGRRIRQITSDGSSGSWQVTEDLKLVSDPVLFGRHIAELRANDNALVRSYVWGLDLSGSLDGAGGVGGLLWVTLHTGSGPAAGTHFAAYDGNGNIVALSAASDGPESARYEYGPFGELIRVTGPAAPLNPFRFSTKRTCNTTDLVLYEYRVYHPAIGRWLSGDPIGELGGSNLSGFVGNRPPIVWDVHGLFGPIDPLPPGWPPNPSTCRQPRNEFDYKQPEPKAIKEVKEILRICWWAPACAVYSQKIRLKCVRDCDGCSWSLIARIKGKCSIYYLDPAGGEVEYKPSLEALLKHERCHCDDFQAAVWTVFSELEKQHFKSKAECENAKRTIDLKARLESLYLGHPGSKYLEGGECYAEYQWKK